MSVIEPPLNPSVFGTLPVYSPSLVAIPIGHSLTGMQIILSTDGNTLTINFMEGTNVLFYLILVGLNNSPTNIVITRTNNY